MAQSSFLAYKKSTIHYLQFGLGDEILFAFHGFGEQAESLLILERSLGEKYTLIAIDIPFHGKTNWNETEHFQPEDLIAIMHLFIAQFQIKTFSVLGFSMGGKCALFCADAFTSSLNQLFLLASDGIKTNKIYNVAVYPKWGRMVFKSTINHPKWLFLFMRIVRKFGFISSWLYKFTFNHMETKEKRQRLYNTWISMSTFNPSIESIKQKLNNHPTQVFLFFGKRDEVIPIDVGNYFAAGLLRCHLTVLDRGHYFIDDRINPFLEAALASN